MRTNYSDLFVVKLMRILLDENCRDRLPTMPPHRLQFGLKQRLIVVSTLGIMLGVAIYALDVSFPERQLIAYVCGFLLVCLVIAPTFGYWMAQMTDVPLIGLMTAMGLIVCYLLFGGVCIHQYLIHHLVA